MEVMYAVGVMLMIFLILTGISFNRQLEINDSSEFLDKKSHCEKFAGYIAGVSSGGSGTYAEVYARYETSVFDGGVVVVGKENGVDSVTATCSFLGQVDLGGASSKVFAEQSEYRVENVGGNVTIA